MSAGLYILAIIITSVCCLLLLRAYHKVRNRLLLWSGLCFAGLTVNNVLVLADMILLPSVDLYSYRLATTAVALSLLLIGMVWERQ